ncbi:MAG: alpha-2-macroglobulin, partial [Flavobacteriaceae bacterium]
MKSIHPIVALLLVLFMHSCQKTPKKETDNLFEFKEYVSYHTQGVQSITTPIMVTLAQRSDSFELTQELPADYFDVEPSLDGKWAIEDGRNIVFQPAALLRPNTEYKVTVLLDKFFPDIKKGFESFSFAFKTLAPNFRIQLGDLQSYDKNWQYLTGTVEASDVLSAKDIDNILSVSQNKSNLTVVWEKTAENAQFFSFKIDSIQRKTEDTEIAVSWDGGALDIENKGTENITIPGLNKFVVVDLKTSGTAHSALTVNFSEPLKPQQNFAGLVTIENAEHLRYEVNGNILKVFPSTRITGLVNVTIHQGIKSEYGFSLKKPFSANVSFEQLKPGVRMISKGTILPSAHTTPIYFEAVNLSAVEVRVIKVFENNMLQYLQNNQLGVGYGSDIRRVGRRIAHKVLPLIPKGTKNTGNWTAHALDLSEMIKMDPGALYRVEFSFKKEHSLYDCGNNTLAGQDGEDTHYEEDLYYDDYGYGEEAYTDTGADDLEDIREERYWDNEIYSWRRYTHNWQQRDNPCHSAYYNQDRLVTTHLLGSDLALIGKKGDNNSYRFVATNLRTAQPEPNTQIKLYNYQQQLLGETTTDGEGFAIYDGDKAVAFAVAERDLNFAYLKLQDGNALSLSKFEVSGTQLQRGLQGFAYTERGVHRPGDIIHLTFVLNDKGNPLPENHPVTLEVTDARGRLTKRTTLSKNGPQAQARNQGDFYYFPIETKPTDPTGTWNAKIIVGGAQFNKSLKVATVKPNRLKVDFGFDETILVANKNSTGKAEVTWLHGAPARNLKIDINAKLQNHPMAFEGFENYTFTDPVRTFEETEIQFLSGKLSDKGTIGIDKKINIGQKAPGMLKATFTTKVYENGGDFSIDVFSKKLAPYDHFVGLRSPKPVQYGSYHTDASYSFDIATVSSQGTATANRKVKVQLFKIEWRWWWNRGDDNLSRYENATLHKPYKSFNVTTDNRGKGLFSVTVPDGDGGRFLIRVIDEASGHATGRIAYFYKNWWKRPTSNDSESSKILIFSADKDRYSVGEEAVITFPSDEGARALISIENGSEVLSTQWVGTNAKETVTKIPITPEMAPNAYVNISLLQPHGKMGNDLPVRLYGVVPILVTNETTLLQPQLDMPNVLKPETPYTISVSEQNGRPMTYSLAVVDEGLLDLTRFNTPDIHNAFYSKQALGVKTFDIFDDVMGAYSVSVDNIYAIGGGGIAQGAKNRKAQRFKPVVSYVGPFTLQAGDKVQHTLDMPNYVGSVRAMVVAGNYKGAYGHTDHTVPVRKPLMVLTSIPRKLSPGETVTIPVTVFAMEEKVRQVTVKIDAGKALKPLGAASKQIRFASVGEQIVNFDFEVLPTTQFQTIQVTASGAGESASSKTEIDVENPNPFTSKSTLYTIEAGQGTIIDLQPYGTTGSNTAYLEFSTLPPMDFSKRMEYLIRYPHGCIEQTTSAAFPQLYMNDVLDITHEQHKKIEGHIKKAIKRLSDFQIANGGLAYWPGNTSASDWGTNYGGHFMLEAKQKGYALPLTFLSNWLNYQKNAARQWSYHSKAYNTDNVQAYRLFTLALAQQPELAAMNRLRESGRLSNEAKWRLAAAYALAGRKDVAQQLVQKANIDFRPTTYDYHTYGSVFRNRAMALETMVILGDSQQRELAEGLARNLASQRWYSTQETAYALLALGKMVAKNGGKSLQLDYTISGTSHSVKTSKAIAQRSIPAEKQQTLTITNQKDNVIYVTLVQNGKLPVGQELVQKKNLDLSVDYSDMAGNSITVDGLRQGTEFTATITVFNTSNDAIQNVALTQIVPSGWEIVDTSYTEDGTPS